MSNVSHQSVESCAFEGGPAKNGFKGFACDLFPFLPNHFLKRFRRIETRFLVRLRKTIPGADVLAYITPKDPVVEITPRILRNFFPEFDRIVGNTSAAIYHIGLGYGLGRACVHACRACAAI